MPEEFTPASPAPDESPRSPLAEWPQLLERLVDGELSAGERANLFRDLDAKPNGWKTCALALLEDREFESALVRWYEPVATTSRVPTSNDSRAATQTPSSQSSRTSVWTTFGLVAASLLCGWFAAGAWQEQGSARVAEVAMPERGAREQSPTVSQPPRTRQLAGRGSVDWQGVPLTHARLASEDDARGVELIGTTASGTELALTLPYVEDTRLAESPTLPASMPASVKHSLRRLGYRVETIRRVAATRTADGRKVLVPVEESVLVPVAHVAF